jgi:hypothetical protein
MTLEGHASGSSVTITCSWGLLGPAFVILFPGVDILPDQTVGSSRPPLKSKATGKSRLMADLPEQPRGRLDIW